MESPGEWIRLMRQRLGLSTRELAALASVSYPTISRIENGHNAPRWDTVAKVARALGATLTPAGLRPADLLRLADLAHWWSGSAGRTPEPDWTQVRAFADQLHRHPELAGAAIAERPEPTGSAMVDNLLAAVAERVADDAGLRRPGWTRSIPGLTESWEAPGTPRMRAAWASRIPDQFAARGLLVPSSAIWREQPVASAT